MSSPINPDAGVHYSKDQYDKISKKLDDLEKLVKKNEHPPATCFRMKVENGKLFVTDNYLTDSPNPPTLFYLFEMKIEDINKLKAEKRIEHCLPFHEHTYTLLDKLFTDNVNAKIGKFGGRNVSLENYDVSLRYVAKKISQIISKTRVFTPSERIIAKRVADKINSLWQNTEELIKNRSFFMRILFCINKLFSWKFTIDTSKIGK